MSSTRNEGSPSAEQALDELGRLTRGTHDTQSLLQTVVDVAKRVMPGDPETSVTVVIKRFPVTVVQTGGLALDCDEIQYGHGHGPCLHSATSGELTEIADTRTETRWRDFMERAAERGALSSLSVPLPLSEEGTSAAMNIYARRANAFDEESRSVATRFAPYAAVAVTNMQAYQNARQLADAL